VQDDDEDEADDEQGEEDQEEQQEEQQQGEGSEPGGSVARCQGGAFREPPGNLRG